MNDWILGANQLVTTNNGEKIVGLLKKKDEKLMKLIKSFSNAMSINYMTEIYNILEDVNNYDLSNISMPEKLIVSKVLLEFKGHFKNVKEQSSFQFKLAQWFYLKKNYSSAYIALSESIVTMVCESNNLNIVSKDERDKAKYIIKSQLDFKNRYSTISNIRNNIAHSIKGRSMPVENDIKSFNEHIQYFKSHIK